MNNKSRVRDLLVSSLPAPCLLDVENFFSVSHINIKIFRFLLLFNLCFVRDLALSPLDAPIN